MDEWKQLRRKMRKQRNQLDEHAREHAALELCHQVITSDLFRRSRHIACYFPVGGEIDTTPIISHIWDTGRRCYLPVLSRPHQNRLWFAPFNADTALRNNRYGIPEPVTSHHEHLTPLRLDLVLTPLVAFDKHCRRLGMGGGYYDRTFNFLLHRRHWHKPRLLGVGYEFQRVEWIHANSWDVALTAVATDESMYFPD